MRVFAGPNGSGKSTLKGLLPGALLGIYLNPDEIEKSARENGWLDLESFGVAANANEVVDFFRASALLLDHGYGEAIEAFRGGGSRLVFDAAKFDSYFASVFVDFVRQKLIAAGESFTFETVMSHPSKVDLLRMAREKGYRTYLYYIATNDAEINVARVRIRVAAGGHPVPEHLIRARYERSLHLLPEAIKHSNRAYIFDNSGEGPAGRTWIAEITDGKHLEFKTNETPGWFRRIALG